MRSGRVVGAVLLVAGVMLAAGAAPRAAAAAASEAEIKANVAERFDADVLRMRKDELDGRSVWLVTLMHRGGNDNAAFKVDTIAVDAETGEPLLGVYPGQSNSENLRSTRTGTHERRPEVLRQRPWR